MTTQPTATAAPTLSANLGPEERRYVLAIAMKYVKNPIDAEDVAQEALLLAHRHRHSFRGQSKYSTWLYRVAATTALMHLRKCARRSRETCESQLGAPEQSFLAGLNCPGPGPEGTCAQRQELSRLVAQVLDLGEKYQDIFVQRWFEGRTEREIAERLSLPLSTVKTRSFRSRRKVLDHYANDELPLAA